MAYKRRSYKRRSYGRRSYARPFRRFRSYASGGWKKAGKKSKIWMFVAIGVVALAMFMPAIFTNLKAKIFNR